jgi:broad specificity phosphatase PhoE
MVTSISFLCAAATASSRTAAFPTPGEPLDDGGARKAAAYSLQGPRPDCVMTSSSRAAIETAAAIGLDARIEPTLSDRAFGDWAGKMFGKIEASDKPRLLAWLADPAIAPPGGESMAELAGRVGAWLDLRLVDDRDWLVISHAAVMRAAIAHALSIPIAATSAIDIAPLSMLELSYNGRWRFRELRRDHQGRAGIVGECASPDVASRSGCAVLGR